VSAVFMLCEPLAGWREVSVSDHRGMVDFAHVIKHLVDEVYPHAEQLRPIPRGTRSIRTTARQS
jgi:hypothetical protein